MYEIVEHYERVREDLRLTSGWGLLEFARTQDLLQRHLPLPPGVVLDIGGATGIYSGWLGSLGYQAHLVDPVERHIEEARRDRRIASAEVGEARQLAWADRSVDAILLLGPLYHLTDPEGRREALLESKRVLRAGGLMFAAGICRFAPLLDSLVRGFVDDLRFIPILERDLSTGQHRNPSDNPDFFTTAFLHLPQELSSELAGAGFELIELVGIEGPAWLARNFEERWADPVRRQQLLEISRRLEHEPALLGVSHHLLVIARKP